MDADLPPEIIALHGQPPRFFDRLGLTAEAHCRHRGRRLCTIDELQHWSQCVKGSGVEPEALLPLGCYQPFDWLAETGPPEIGNVLCEFAAEMVPLPDDGQRRRPLVRALVHQELDERGYGQLYLIDNNDISCAGGAIGARCCLDL